jgi:hypothetical protein
MTSNPWLDMVSLINGVQVSQAISVAATLRVADHLKDGPRSADELASMTESNADGPSIVCYARLLRRAASRKWIARNSP